MTRGWLPQRSGLPGLNGGGAAATVPPDCDATSMSCDVDWIGLSSILHPRQHSIGYMGDDFYRSKDPTNSITVLKEVHIVHREIKHTISRHEQKHSKSPSLHQYGVTRGWLPQRMPWALGTFLYIAPYWTRTTKSLSFLDI